MAIAAALLDDFDECGTTPLEGLAELPRVEAYYVYIPRPLRPRLLLRDTMTTILQAPSSVSGGALAKPARSARSGAVCSLSQVPRLQNLRPNLHHAEVSISQKATMMIWQPIHNKMCGDMRTCLMTSYMFGAARTP